MTLPMFGCRIGSVVAATLLAASVWLCAACKTTEKAVTLDEARSISLAFAGSAFTPPPRTIDDLEDVLKVHVGTAVCDDSPITILSKEAVFAQTGVGMCTTEDWCKAKKLFRLRFDGDPDWIMAMMGAGRMTEAGAMLAVGLEKSTDLFGRESYAAAEINGLYGVYDRLSGDAAGAFSHFSAAAPALMGIGAPAGSESDALVARNRRKVFILEHYLDLLADAHESLVNGPVAVDPAAASFTVAESIRGNSVQQAAGASPTGGVQTRGGAGAGAGMPDIRTRAIRITETASLDDDRLNSAILEMLQPLPDTREEVLGIATALGADSASDVFLGRNASEGVLKRTDLSDRRVLVFATHGLLPGDLDGLQQPALALSSPRLTGDEANDGLLTSDLFNRQAADPTLSRAEALRQSMLDLMDNGVYHDPATGAPAFAYAHPIFWAPFSLVEEGGR